jgi:hypothetical protein
MRSRSIVLVACIGAMAVGVLLASTAAGAARQQRSRVIVCPQQVDPITNPCCGPPISSPDAVPGCCPTTAVECAVPRLTLTSSQDPADAGSKLQLSGELIDTSESGKTIQLWQKLPGASSFTQTLSTTTSSTGSYSFTLAKGSVMTNRSWYATGAGLTSATVQQGVSLVLTLAENARLGHAILHGSVKPATKGSVVLEWLNPSGRWIVLGRARLSRSSGFSWRSSYKPHGSAKVRAAVVQNADHVASFSASLTARVLRR